MAIMAKGGGNKDFIPCPAGVHQGVCVDVVDLGMVTSTFVDDKTGQPKIQHKADIVWQTSEAMADGRPFLVKKRYTLSLHEKATLRHDLESWRGRPFSEIEAEGFDVERLLGVNALLNVQHKAGSKGGTFANVVSLMPLPKNMPPMKAPGDYLRVCDRMESQEQPESQADDDSIPF